MEYAPIVEEFTFTAEGAGGQINIANLDSIVVYGITIHDKNTTGGANRTTVEVRNGTVTVGEWSTVRFSDIHVDIKWVADNGLNFRVDVENPGAETNISVTVFRSHTGT